MCACVRACVRACVCVVLFRLFLGGGGVCLHEKNTYSCKPGPTVVAAVMIMNKFVNVSHTTGTLTGITCV